MRDVDAVADGNTNKNSVLKNNCRRNTYSHNMNLGAVGSAITTGDTSSVAVPTVGQVATFGNQWGGAAKTVSNSDPAGGQTETSAHFR